MAAALMKPLTLLFFGLLGAPAALLRRHGCWGLTAPAARLVITFESAMMQLVTVKGIRKREGK